MQRPDVRKAEQELVSANARIGIAKAQYLPTIGLTAQYGFASAELNTLLQSSSNVSSFGAILLGPIFTSGRIAGQVREAEAIQQQKAMAYLLSVQTALREVEDALVLHRQTWQRSAIRARQLEALRAHARSALKRYEGGRSSYLEVLDADREHLRRRGPAEPDPPRPVHRADFRLQGDGRRLERQRFPACRPHREGEDK